MVRGNPSRMYSSKITDLTEKEWDNALLDIMRNKYIGANAEANLPTRETMEKYKKLTKKRHKRKKKRRKKIGHTGKDFGSYKETEKPQELQHVHSEDSGGVMFMNGSK